MNELNDRAAEGQRHHLAVDDQVRPEAIDLPLGAEPRHKGCGAAQRRAAQRKDLEVDAWREETPVLRLVAEAADDGPNVVSKLQQGLSERNDEDVDAVRRVETLASREDKPKSSCVFHVTPQISACQDWRAKP